MFRLYYEIKIVNFAKETYKSTVDVLTVKSHDNPELLLNLTIGVGLFEIICINIEKIQTDAVGGV